MLSGCLGHPKTDIYAIGSVPFAQADITLVFRFSSHEIAAEAPVDL
jgi:hypothetical protein